LETIHRHREGESSEPFRIERSPTLEEVLLVPIGLAPVFLEPGIESTAERIVPEGAKLDEMVVKEGELVMKWVEAELEGAMQGDSSGRRGDGAPPCGFCDA
jgi:hypothetical protein